jgi:Na+/melibiose symporter-like transporter
MGISMSREDYVAIGVRLFAVYVGIKTVLALPASAQAVFRGDGMAFAWLYALVLILAVGICVFLWFFPLTIARKLLPVMKEQRSEESIDASVGLSLGLTLLGVWFLAQGLLDSLYWLSLVLRTKHLVQAQQYGFEWQPDQIASMAVTLFELIIGAWLVLGSTGVRRLIYKFRYGSS